MALNETHFDYADRGAMSVYKFRAGDDETTYVWFEYGEGEGSLHTTPIRGPYDVNDPLEDAECADLDALLKARGVTKAQWIEDLMAQYGAPLAWTYP